MLPYTKYLPTAGFVGLVMCAEWTPADYQKQSCRVKLAAAPDLLNLGHILFPDRILYYFIINYFTHDDARLIYEWKGNIHCRPARKRNFVTTS